MSLISLITTQSLIFKSQSKVRDHDFIIVRTYCSPARTITAHQSLLNTLLFVSLQVRIPVQHVSPRSFPSISCTTTVLAFISAPSANIMGSGQTRLRRWFYNCACSASVILCVQILIATVAKLTTTQAVHVVATIQPLNHMPTSASRPLIGFHQCTDR